MFKQLGQIFAVQIYKINTNKKETKKWEGKRKTGKKNVDSVLKRNAERKINEAKEKNGETVGGGENREEEK